jgi:hypothetical protein
MKFLDLVSLIVSAPLERRPIQARHFAKFGFDLNLQAVISPRAAGDAHSFIQERVIAL